MKVAEQVNDIFGNLICQHVQDESDMGETMVGEKIGAEGLRIFLLHSSFQTLERFEQEQELLTCYMALSCQSFFSLSDPADPLALTINYSHLLNILPPIQEVFQILLVILKMKAAGFPERMGA